MKRSTKKSSTTLKKTSINKNSKYPKTKPTKIIIDSSKKVTSNKDDEKQIQDNKNENIKASSSLTENDKKNKIIHENNLNVIEIIQKELDKVEKENEIILNEMKNLKEQEKELKETYEKIRDNIETEKDELEELRDINDEKNREYLQLMHLRHRQIMDNPITHSNDTERNHNNGNNTSVDNSNNENSLNRFTLGEVMDGLLRIRIRRENDNDEVPFIFLNNRENNEDGPPMTYEQLQNLQSSSYPRTNNNNNEKCIICGFDFCFNDIFTKLICNHIFHKNCLINRLSARQSSKCPTCKASII